MVQTIIIILLLSACVVLAYTTARLYKLLDAKESECGEIRTSNFELSIKLDNTRNELADAKLDISNKNDTIEKLEKENKDLLNAKKTLQAALDETTKKTTRRTTNKVEPEKVEEPKKTTRRTTKK